MPSDINHLEVRVSLVDIPETMDLLARAIDDGIETTRLVTRPNYPETDGRWEDGFRAGWLAAKESVARTFATIRVRRASEALARAAD